MWPEGAERRYAYRVWWGNPRDGENLKGLDVDGRIILNWILYK
jgi:hypothetical protein